MTEHFSASEVATFIRALQQFGVTCAEAAEGFRMPDGPEIIDDQPEWYEDANPWDAHTVSFGDTLERIDHTLTLHQEGTNRGDCVRCGYRPRTRTEFCDQCQDEFSEMTMSDQGGGH